MGLKLGWFAVRNIDAATIQAALERLKELVPAKHRPSGFRIADAPAPRPSLVNSLLRRPVAPPYASAAPAGWSFAEAPVWAEAISNELGEVVISFVVFEGTWSYVVFDRGERILAMEWDELPALSGDAAKAAAAFGVDPSLFERYRGEIERVCKLFSGVDEDDIEAVSAAEEALERIRPFRGDKYRPSDEWAHLDFAKRLGRIDYPDTGVGIQIDWSRPLPTQSLRDREAPLGVGDRVAHERGVGEVTNVDTVDGGVVYGLRLANGKTCKAPRSAVRLLMNEADLNATFDVLSEAEPEEQAFAERFSRHTELMKIGTGPALAEIVRDLTRSLTAGDPLSSIEKRILEGARSRLVEEIVCIRDVPPETVTRELTEACRQR